MKSIFLLKGRDGSIVAKGTLIQGERNTIHGKTCRNDCKVEEKKRDEIKLEKQLKKIESIPAFCVFNHCCVHLPS